MHSMTKMTRKEAMEVQYQRVKIAISLIIFEDGENVQDLVTKLQEITSTCIHQNEPWGAQLNQFLPLYWLISYFEWKTFFQNRVERC